MKVVREMTTEREVWLAEHPSSPATTCTCGQELDLCHREHCPRCGVRVVRVVAAAA
jgi:hypothetical protein